MFKINSVPVKTPSVMTVDVSDLDDKTTRTADGGLVRDRITVKRKITLSWRVLTPSELSEIMGAVSSVFFTATYPDPATGTTQTRTFYVSDRTAAVYTYHDGTVVWENLGFSIIER